MMPSFILAALALLAALECVVAWKHLIGNTRLAEVTLHDDVNWPSVSVVMAARDEADRIGAALASRLADDYPNLELVLVDDRSTDQTARAARRVARDDSRFQIVRVDELPGGWLGKVHALNVGAGATNSDYVLFSDADVTVERGTLRRAVAYAERRGIDCLALVPEYVSASVLIDATWTVFMRALCLALDPAKIADARSKAAIGSGAFTLVRREALERTPGFEHLRMESADDMALAAMVKAAGGRCEGVVGTGCASVRMYDSLPAFLEGVEKNGGTTAAHPIAATAGILGFAIVDLAPLVALAAGPPWLRAIALSALAVQWIANVAITRETSRTWASAFLWPIGTAVFAFGVLRATWLAVARKGVVWRGTFYPLADLEAGRRFTL